MSPFEIIPEFGGHLFTAVAFFVALSVIVAVHEYGHYIVGRWSGIHAETFSIGFGPSLVSWVDKRQTRWQIALLPLGGFVKFAGDSDAASGKDQDTLARMDPAELRRTMHGAPLWARMLTVAAGPVFNFIVAVIIFASVYMVQGEYRTPLTIGSINPLPSVGSELRSGDRVIAIAGVPVPVVDGQSAVETLVSEVPQTDVLEYTIVRDATTMVVKGPYILPPLVQMVAPLSAADDSGLRPGDVITAVNGESIFAFHQLRDYVVASGGAPLRLSIWRDGSFLDLVLTPKRRDEPVEEGGYQSEWRIGVVGGRAFEPARTAIGPGLAILKGFMMTERVIEGSFSGLYHMITGAISACNLSGIISIAEASGSMASQGIENFLWFIAILSVAIGLINLFPIPALDGGHLLFFAYEGIVGRPPNDYVSRALMIIGVTFIASIMLLAIGTDLWCP